MYGPGTGRRTGRSFSGQQPDTDGNKSHDIDRCGDGKGDGSQRKDY
jgi:hypothetical protein